ncbi:Odorant receptor 89 [Blattella germanica]|nr:Odorant receptor 89 [Blattella germanica]
MEENFPRTKKRFSLYVFFLRAAGVPIFMKRKWKAYIAYEIILYSCSVALLITSWLRVVNERDNIREMMATMRIAAGMLVIVPFNFCVRFQLKKFENVIEMTEGFTWEEMPFKDPIMGTLTSAGMLPLIWKIIKYGFMTMGYGHLIQSFYRIIVNHELMFRTWCPIDCHASIVFEVTNISHIMTSILAACSFFGYMGIYCSLVAIGCSQFDKLKMNMLSIYHTEQYNSNMDYHLQACVRHHQQIFQFIREMENVFTIGMCLTLLVLMTSTCIAAFSAVISRGEVEDVVQIIMLYVAWMTSICVICWTANELSDKAESVKNAAYEGEWIGTSISFQRSVLLIITRSNKIFNLTAGKFVLVNNETMMNILNETLSLFMFLLNMKDKTVE